LIISHSLALASRSSLALIGRSIFLALIGRNTTFSQALALTGRSSLF